VDGLGWTIVPNLLAVVLLVLANGFFVASEFSLVALRRSRIDQLNNAGHPIGPSLINASKNLDSYLAATQLGITLSSLGLGWMGEPAVAAVLEPLFSGLPPPLNVLGTHTVAFIVAFTLITVLHIVFGELVPKSLALQRAEAVSIAIVRPLGFFLVLFWPAIFVLNGFGNWLLRRAGLNPSSGEEHLHSPEELKLLFNASSEAGLIREVQGDLVDRALNLGDRKIAACMTSRQDFEWIDPDDPIDELRAQVLASSYNRFPVRVKDGGLPAMVSAKAILALEPGTVSLPDQALEPAVLVSEGAGVLQVLDRFRRERIECALVVDLEGTDFEGLVTTHDLFEALAGEQQDPFEESGNGPLVEKIYDASMSMDEFRRMLRRPGLGAKDRAEYHTAAGFAIERLRHIPNEGTRFRHDGLNFEIREMQRYRITRIAVSPTGSNDPA
jgi:putative hemolysin